MRDWENRVMAGEVDWGSSDREEDSEREQTVSGYWYWGQRSCPIKYRWLCYGT